MTLLEFNNVSRFFLNRLNLSFDENFDFKSLKDLNSKLQLSGFNAIACDVLKGIIPVQQKIKMGILFHQDGASVLFESKTDGFYKLEIKNVNDNSEPLPIEDLKNYQKAVVIVERETANGTIREFIRNYSGRLWDILLASFLVNFFALSFPLYSSFVYDKILGNHIYETLWALSVSLFFILSIEFTMRLLRIKTSERFSVSSETDMDSGYFKNLMKTEMHSLPNAGLFLEKYKQLSSYRDFLSSNYILSLADLPFLALFLISILIIAGPMVMLIVIFGGLVSAISATMLKPVLFNETISKKASEKRFSLLYDVLISKEIIIGKAFKDSILQKLMSESVTAAITSGKARYWRGVSQSLTNSLSYLSYISVLIAGVYMVDNQYLTSGGLLAVSLLSSRAMTSISNISGLLIRYKEFQTALESMNAILPDKAEVKIIPHGKLSGHIHLEKVSCSLGSDETPILDRIDLSFQPGEIVGIAGAPGAGKTTLLRLLTGSISCRTGRILFDHIPIQNLDPSDVTESIGYKPQDLCLIDGTIEENIVAGRSPLNAEERQALLMKSGLGFGFVESRLNWDTPVGMRGGNLSGGQRQLVSLARAFAYHPSILILDEPTNGLNAQLEVHLSKQINQLRGNTTVIISTHSQHLLSVCDRIIVIGNGKILANGPRDKVLVRNS